MFITTIDHDTPFDLGFIFIEINYILREILCNERLRAHLLHIPFDYSICLYKMSLVDYFARALEVQSCMERIVNGPSVD